MEKGMYSAGVIQEEFCACESTERMLTVANKAKDNNSAATKLAESERARIVMLERFCVWVARKRFP